ncbi:TerD family protein [Streptomyces sp. NA02950]|uniref:CAP domain-containing protein n=1 Tax=Streptomyces sp. NA02950 TaxID=2742137 RepID=UPI00159266A7|nr:CAP domain-containing protein [Streptomyces sp. NA02950]QKV96822.1 TerD family protein [Streptomyces sp. NA02950]
MGELVPGGNLALPDGALTIRVPGPFDLSALITGADGKVAGDADFVFFNQPSAPGARLHGDTLALHPRRLRPDAERITVVVSPADPATPLGRLPVPALTVLADGGVPVARFTPPRPAQETLLLLAEVYRRGGRWKVRALGQGYADGLAGLARDFGVDVADDGPRPAAPAPSPPQGQRSAPGGPLEVVNAARARAGAPPLTLDTRLTAAAEAHAGAMATAGRLAMEGPDGISLFHRIATAGYRCLTVDEHLISGPRTPEGFVDYCLSDAERRGPFGDPAVVHIGLGRAVGPGGDIFWTAVWARPFTPDGLGRLTSEVIALTNAERAAARLAPLTPEPRLTTAAQRHSDDMVARDFYSHTGPEGQQPWDRARAAGAGHRGIGENIACGQRSAAEVVRGWMDSPGHRANILKPDFTHIGVGYTTGSRAGTYWTQVFGGV